MRMCVADIQRPVLRHAFELAKRLILGGRQKFPSDIRRRNVVNGRMARLQNPIAFDCLGYGLACENNAKLLAHLLQSRWSGVVSHGFLPWAWLLAFGYG